MNENSLLLEKACRGDRKAEEELVVNNMGLVRSIAGRFSHSGCDTDDLAQIGAMGLIKAIHKFDLSYGVKFSTYAVPVIMGEIKRFLRDDGMIKVSRSIKENALKGKRCAERLRTKLGREPTFAELSKECGIDEEMLIEAFDAAAPIDTITPEDKDGAQTELPVADGRNSEDDIVDKIFIRDMLESLNTRERKIIVLRYFKGKTQSETAKIIGVSQVQISRIEKAVLSELRERFS